MIEGERETHSRISNVACGSLLHAVNDGANTENTGLRRIDNGSKAFNTERTEVGNGKACAGKLIGADLSALSLADQSLGLSSELVERQGLCQRKGGNEKSSFGINSNAEIYVLKESHLIVQIVSVQILVCGKGLSNCVENDIVEGDIRQAHCFSACLEGCAECHDLGSIKGCIERKLSRVGERSVHRLCNHLSHVGKLHFLILACINGNRSSLCGCSDSSFGSGALEQALIQSKLNVSFDDSALGTGGNNLGKVYVGLICKHSCTGRNFFTSGVCGSSCNCGGSSRSSLFFCSRSGRSSLCGCSIILGSELREILTFVTNYTYVFETRNVLALFLEDCKKSTLYLCFFIKGRLVGFVREKNVANAYLISYLFAPGSNNAALYALTLARHDNCGCHNNTSKKNSII